MAIGDKEVLIRAVTSWNVKNRSLDKNLFKHPDDAISVSRRTWVAPWLAKLYAKARVEKSQLTPPKLYVGLAFISARDVKQVGSAVVDSRHEYLGHADISNGVKQVRGEALPAEISKLLNDRAKAIAAAARFVPDPHARSLRWTQSDQ